MKHIKKYNQIINENLKTTLDIGGGESLLDIKIEKDVPKHLIEYIPTIGDVIDSKGGYSLFISCNKGETIYHFEDDSSKIYTKDEFNNSFYDYDEYIYDYNEYIYDNRIINIVNDYFNCDQIDIFLQHP
jgi:hypothetical protein